MAFAYLDDDTLMEVRHAAIELGFNSDGNLAALAAGMSPAFVGTHMVGPSGNARLLTLTAAMNTTRSLMSGEVPLEKWLDNAILLAAGAQQELVFRKALEQMAADSLPEKGVAPDVDAAPKQDGGALEIQIDEDDTLGVGFLLEGAIAARSVAKLFVHRHFDGEPAFRAGGEPDVGFGTGWLIGPNLAITNYHVINARAKSEPDASEADFDLQGKATAAEFDYYRTGAATKTVAALACEASDRALDFAVLRLDDGSADRLPMRLRKNPLTRPQASALKERVNVLQHPAGDPMRLGFRNNFVVVGSNEKLSYLTDTAGGSSGSPICDDAWFVAGLHRGWSTIKGEPVSVWGKEIKQENYGTPIGLILAHLEAASPALHEEIVGGQP